MARRPPLNALHCFDTVARLGGLVRAAEAMNLTHGAVSRQIRILEDHLGVALFERRNRGAFLTPRGARLREATALLFEQVGRALDEARRPDLQPSLVVSCEPTMAMKWLIPQLQSFYDQYPGVQIDLRTGRGAVDFRREGIDVALRHNDFVWGRTIFASKMAEEWIGPVCAPSLLVEGKLHLGKQTALVTSTRPSAWRDWTAAANLVTVPKGTRAFDYFYLSLQAATSGMGVSISSAFMVQEEIERGDLAAPFGFVRDGSAFYLLSAEAFESDDRRMAFAHWLRDSMQAVTLRCEDRE